MNRWLLLVPTVACLLLVGPSPGWAAPAGHATAGPRSAAPPTTVRHVSPLEHSGHLAPGYTVTHHYPDASCVSGSPTTGTAYECFSAGSPEGVFDTCWVQANVAYVTCLANPWTHTAVRLHVTGGYDDRGGFPHVAAPWGVRLGRSIRCLIDLGSVKSAGGHPITYHCTRHIVLTDQVTRTAATWRAHAYRRVAHKGRGSTFTPLGRQPVAVGWRGRASRSGRSSAG
jgi:hypothetical protein